MVHCSRRRLFGTLLALIILIALTALLVLVGQARAGEPAPSPSPSVVREVVESRTVDSKTYLLSDGRYRCVMYQSPIHYQDENGDWQPIDTSLVPAGGIDAYATVATPVEVTLADEAPGQKPVTVASGAWAVTMNLVGWAEDEKIVFDNAAVYTNVAPDTDVTYTVTGEGVKEILTLASPAAPNTFTYQITHPGLALRQDEGGQWGLYAPGSGQPVFRVGAMNVCDSSLDAADEPAYCEGARMTVTPGVDGSTVTFTLPRAWLSDPARVWPVKIDPELGQGNTLDTYLSAGYPSQSFGTDADTLCGNMNSAAGKCRTLVRFPQANSPARGGVIPEGSHISSATFKLRCYWQPATNQDAVGVGKLASSTILWGEASTYNGANANINIEYNYSNLSVTEQSWLDVDCQAAVQDWLDTGGNKGFVVYESDASGSGYSKKFRSRQYSDVTYQPRLTVDYENPTASTTGAPASSHVGDTLSVTVTGTAANASQITSLQLGVNRASGIASRYRGYVGWFANSTPQSGWSTPVPVTSGTGYYAYTTAAGDNNSAITLLSCTHSAGGSAATFSFRINDAWSTLGDVQDSTFDARLDMSSGSRAWHSGWFSGGQPMDLLVSAIPGTVTSTAAPISAADPWFVGAQPNDDAARARSKVNLSWTRAPGAAGYKIFLSNGMSYKEIAYVASAATGLSWTTEGKGLFPSGSALRGLLTGTSAWKNVPQGYQGNVFIDFGAGLDLRDDPNELYNRVNPGGSGALHDSKYHFAIVPWNGSGAWLPGSEWSFKDVQLDGRSVFAQEQQHTATDLGSWDGHSLGAWLDKGKLTAGVTDLEVASLGPSAAVSRAYRVPDASETYAPRFAPDWWFNFDQKLVFNLSAAPASVTFVDDQNVSHVFYRGNVNDAWEAPNGYFAELTQNADTTWKLLFDDQHYLTFANTTGALLSETDAHGLQATYTWGANALTITAANGQSVSVTFSAGRVTGASYATGAGTRTVAYSSASPWQVTYNAADPATARSVKYAYDANGWLSEIAQEAWPTSGQSAVLRLVNSGAPVKVTEVDYPDMFTTDAAHTVAKSDAKATITYDSATQATVKHFGTVAGVANQAMRQTTYTWDATTSTNDNSTVEGRTKTEAETTASGTATSTFFYSDDQQVRATLTAVGSDLVGLDQSTIEDDVVVGTNDVTTEVEATDVTPEPSSTPAAKASDGQRTDYIYDSVTVLENGVEVQHSLHRVKQQTTYRTYDPSTGVKADPTTTLYTYDAYGNVSETQVRDGGATGTLVSDVQRTYDASGHLTSEKHWVSGSTWTETQYSNFAPNGEPQTTVAKNVQLSYGGAPQDLTKSSSYDGFGNLLSETDWGGRTTETNSYDLAGRVLTSTDASGVVTHTAYDCLGNQTESYRTATGTSMKADWRVTAYDAMGRATEVTTKLSDGSGNPTTQSVVTSVYDGSGNQLSRHDSTVGGEDEKWLYDAQGNVTEHWALGVRNYTDSARSTRTSYDAQGQTTGVSDPGNSSLPGAAGSATTAYSDGGQVTASGQPDGSSTAYLYDDEGNQTIAESTVTGTSSSIYGADGRLASQTNERNFTTGSTYDGLGRVTGATGSGQGATTTSYNHLGWVLRTVDASGVTTLKSYDAYGNVTGETVGSQGTTVSEYSSATGRLSKRTDPNGSAVTYTYDAFGNVKRELHQASDNTVLKDFDGSSGATYDSLGRPTSRTEVVSGRSQSWTYPVNTAGGVQETLTYSAQTSTAISRNSRGQETNRETTTGSDTLVTLSIADDGNARDAADRWVSAVITPAGGSTQVLARSFDNAGRPTSQSGAGLAAAGSYSYDASSGLKAAQTLPLSMDVASAYDNYAYAADGRLQTWSVRATPTATPSPMATYSYSSSGNLTGDTGTGTTFAYDSANRLTSSLRSGATTYYGWDAANGWRTCQGPNSSPTPANEPIVYTYVKSGASTSNGRMTRYQNSATSTDASYAYDAVGQRTKSTVTVAGTTTTTTYDYDGLTLLSLSGTQDATTWRIDYLYDEEGTPYGGVYRSPAISTSPKYFTMITNDHGDVLELLDANGAAFASYRYDPWGSPLGSGTTTQATSLITATLPAEIASRQVVRYASYTYDSESGLYYCSARYYDPATRQWTTGDVAKADGEESAYQYCKGDPVGHVDPSGNRRVSQSWHAHKQELWTAQDIWLRLRCVLDWTVSGKRVTSARASLADYQVTQKDMWLTTPTLINPHYTYFNGSRRGLWQAQLQFTWGWFYIDAPYSLTNTVYFSAVARAQTWYGGPTSSVGSVVLGDYSAGWGIQPMIWHDGWW